MTQKGLLMKKIDDVTPDLDKKLNMVEKIYREGINLGTFERYWKWGDVEDFVYQNRNKLCTGDVKRLIEFGREFRDLKGPERNIIEESLFSMLRGIVSTFHNVNIFKSVRNKLPILKDEIDAIEKKRVAERFHIFLEIEKFAVDSYRYKRSRDSFGGQRRACVLGIMGHLRNFFKDTKGFELAVESLKSKSRAELNAAFDFLREYYLSLEVEPEPEIIEKLYKIVDRTDKRAIASGALSVLVDTGVIC
jgi:hypothetical protein